MQLYLLDITYTLRKGRAIIQLHGVANGKPVILEDDTFEPYFYCQSKDKRLATLKDGEYKVVRVEAVHKNLLEKPLDVSKIVVNVPGAIPLLREQAKKYGQTFEDDILFTRRYLIDNQITPLGMITVIEKNGKVQKVQKGEGEYTPKALAIDIETYTPPERKEIDYNNPIIMIALFGKGMEKVLTWKKAKNAEIFENEKEMLEAFVKEVNNYNPDIIIGYNSDGFDFPYLAARAKKKKVSLAIGRDGTPLNIKGRGRQEAKMVGRQHVDLYPFIRRVLGRNMKTGSFSLNNVVHELLGEKKVKIDIGTIGTAWDAGKIDPFVSYNLHDARITWQLYKKIWPSLLEMTRIVGLTLFEASRLSFSQYVEWYMMRQAYKENELIPAKPGYHEQTRRKHVRAQGGFVFEPKPGVYEKIAVFDYRSLYPSIIASKNISPGTIHCKCCTGTVPEHDMHFCKKKQGFVSKIIKELLAYRISIKKQLKNSKDAVLEARVYGLKVLLNSFYGYLGFAMARWYSSECVSAITAYARHYIKQVMRQAEHHGYIVRYGDTDSLMAELGTKSKTDATAFMREVNKKLPDPMELELEGVYPAGIWVATKEGGGAKKRYALLDENNHLIIKGFESVRRNAAPIAKKAQQNVLMIVLKEKDKDKAIASIKKVVDKLRKNQVPLEDVIITTQLQKTTDKYENISPHVAIAKALEKKGWKVGRGTPIRYVVCKGQGKIRDRVKLPEDTAPSEYDGEYYVNNSVIPAVENIILVLGVTAEELTQATRQTTLARY